MHENLRAQIVDHRLAEHQGEKRAEVESRPGPQRDQPKDERPPERAARVAARNRPLDDVPDQPCSQGKLYAARQHDHEQPIAVSGIRPRVGDDTADQTGIQRTLFPLIVFIITHTHARAGLRAHHERGRRGRCVERVAGRVGGEGRDLDRIGGGRQHIRSLPGGGGSFHRPLAGRRHGGIGRPLGRANPQGCRVRLRVLCP